MVKLIAFALVVAAMVGLFAYNLRKAIRIALLGKPAELDETWGERIASLMTFFFGQRKVVEEKRSWHHLALYWGFLVIQVGLLDMMITGLLLPSSIVTRFSPAIRQICSPISRLPVKLILRIRGSPQIASPSSPPGPVRQAMASGGMPASSRMRVSSRAERGVSEAGLIRMAFPAAIAGPTL